MFGVSMDDGPTISSPVLYEFLEAHNQSSTHFMIGGNIAQLPEGEESSSERRVGAELTHADREQSLCRLSRLEVTSRFTRKHPSLSLSSPVDRRADLSLDAVGPIPTCVPPFLSFLPSYLLSLDADAPENR